MDNTQNPPNPTGGDDRPSRFSPASGSDRMGGGTGLGDRPGGQGGPGGPGGDRPGGERFGGERPGGERGPRRYGSGGGRGGGGRGGGGGRRKQPIFADNEVVDYKDIQRLRQCIDERGKLLPRRKTYCSAGKQRELTTAVKRARHLALLMFVPADRRR